MFPNSANPNRLLQVHFMKICSTIHRLFLSQSIGLLSSDLHNQTMLYPRDANVSAGWRQRLRDSNPAHSLDKIVYSCPLHYCIWCSASFQKGGYISHFCKMRIIVTITPFTEAQQDLIAKVFVLFRHHKSSFILTKSQQKQISQFVLISCFHRPSTGTRHLWKKSERENGAQSTAPAAASRKHC